MPTGSTAKKSRSASQETTGPAHGLGATVAARAKTAAATAAAASFGMTAAVLAGGMLIRIRARPKHVLGLPVPGTHRSGLSDIAKHVASMAGQLETKSDEVKRASARGKQAAQMLASTSEG